MEPELSMAELAADIDGALKRVRGQGPVVSVEVGPMVVEHEALRQLLLDRRLRPSFSSVLKQVGVTSGAFYDWMSRSPLDMEGDAHRQWRSVMARAFTPNSVERLRPYLARECARLADALADAGRCEFVDAFARELPSLGLCELVGVPVADRDTFRGWADTIGLGFNLMLVASRIDEVDAAITALRTYAAGLVEMRRREPRDDFVTRMIRESEQEGGLDPELIAGTVAGLVFAGHETTKNQLGWLIHVLSEVPAEWDAVAEDPSRARAVVEEVLRLRSAATSVGRLVLAPLELHGRKLSPGDQVVGSLWAANRDPSAFPDPDRFDPELHGTGAQIAFGHGPHHCLGAALARAELQESLIALSQRITCPTLEPDATWLPPIGITGPTALPICYMRRG